MDSLNYPQFINSKNLNYKFSCFFILFHAICMISHSQKAVTFKNGKITLQIFFDKLVNSSQLSLIINQQTTIIISSSKVFSIVTLVSQCRIFSPGDTLISGKFSRSLSFKEQHRHVDQGRVVGTPSGWKGSGRWWTWAGKFMKVKALNPANEILAGQGRLIE